MTLSKDIKLTGLIFAFTFLLFANTIGHGFTWDDSIVITENSKVQKGISGIPDLFLKYNSDYKADKYGYRPIVLSTFAIEYSLFQKNPNLMHLMNVFYFSMLCVVIFKGLKMIFFSFSSLVPFLITILFACHPIHTEVVANIKSRDEIFAMLFGLLSLNQFMLFDIERKLNRLGYGILLFLLAFLSKESAVVFLLIIPLTLLYKTNWSNYKSIIKPILILIPLLIICLTIVYLYTHSSLGRQASKGAGIYYEGGILGNSFFYTDIFSSKLANAFTVLILYLKNFFLPNKLVYFYGYNQVPVANWNQFHVIFSVIFHSVIFILALIYRKKYKEISYGILFYFSSVFIYTHLLRTLADTMADRFLFVPSLGLIIASVFLIGKLLKVNFETLSLNSLLFNSKSGKSNQGYLKYSFGLIIICLSITTFARNKVWKSNETLIFHDMPYLENCARAHNYYADILKSKLSKSFDPNLELQLISHYRKSISISKESYYSYLGLGMYYCGVKKYSEGLQVFEEMLSVFPDQADPNFYLGQTYFNIQQYDKAIKYLQNSLDLATEVTNTYYFLALALSKKGNYDKAISIINLAKQKFGESAYIYEALGNIYFDKNDLDSSTKFTFELLRFGQEPQKVYGIVIGRYQSKKLDAPAAYYYRQALERGVFQK